VTAALRDQGTFFAGARRVRLGATATIQTISANRWGVRNAFNPANFSGFVNTLTSPVCYPHQRSDQHAHKAH